MTPQLAPSVAAAFSTVSVSVYGRNEFSSSQRGLALRKRHLKTLTCAAVREPISLDNLMLLSGPNCARAALNRTISPGPHLERVLDTTQPLSRSAASLTWTAQTSAICLSRMWVEQDRVEGNVRVQNRHAFSSDPSTAAGESVAPCACLKWSDTDLLPAWEYGHSAHWNVMASVSSLCLTPMC